MGKSVLKFTDINRTHYYGNLSHFFQYETKILILFPQLPILVTIFNLPY